MFQAPIILMPPLNGEASKIPIGSEGIIALPFGNGAERMLNNEIVGGAFS
jgi:xylulokinase